MSKAEQTRAFIIEKTAPVFNKKGFAGTSLTDLTEATGLTKGSIYGNFANKDEVALAVFDYNLKKVENTIGAEMAKQHTVKDQLLVYAKVYGGFLKTSIIPGGCPIQNTAVEADDTHPALKEKAKAAILSWKAKIIKLLEKGRASKEFTASFDAEQVALTIIAMTEGGILISSITGKTNYMKLVTLSVEKLVADLE